MDEKKFKEAFAALAKDRNQRQALSALLIEFIEPNHLSSDIVSLFLNTRALDPGSALVKKVRRGIEVRKLVPGSIHLASEVTVTDRINYVLDGADVKVHASLWELESGEIGTVADLRSEMQAKLTDYYVNRVFNALATIWSASNTPNNFTSVGGNLTAAALKNAIDNINQRVGRVRAVVGTRKALTPITTFGAGYDIGGTQVDRAVVEPALLEIYRTGWLGVYYGAPIVALDQIFDDPISYTPLLPEDKVVVVGDKVGEWISYGDVRDKMYDWMEPTPPVTVLELYQQWGMIVDNAQGIHVLGDIS